VGRIPPDARLGMSGLILLQRTGVLLLAGMAVLLATGCAQNEIGRYTGYYVPVITNPQRVRNAIVKSENYWIQKEVAPQEEFPGPTPDDLKPSEVDYILGPGDLVDITVFELMAPGQPYVSRLRISQSGQVSFPYIGAIKCAGLTTRGLEEKLSDLLSPDYLSNPQVSVFVSEYRNLNVSVLNGVARPGLYPMAKQDMTLLELVAMSGGIMQLTEDYGYVIRKYAPEEADLLALESGVPPAEEGAGGEKPAPKKALKPGEKPPAENPETPAEKTPGAKPPQDAGPAETPITPKAPGKVEKAPQDATPEPAAKPATKTPPAAAPKAPRKPAADPKAETKKESVASPAKERAGKAPEKTPAETAKDARELLEKMAAGEMPAVQKIEKAEVAAAQKSPAASPAPAAENSPGSAAKPAVTAAAALAKDEKELGRWIWSDGKWVEVKDKSAAEAKPAVAAKPAETKPAEEKPAVAAKPAETKPAEEKPAVVAKPGEEKPAEAKPGEEAKVAEAVPPEEARGNLEEKLRRMGVVQGAGQLRRIIRFDVRALQAGDPTQNVILRDGDVVTIPAPLMGDFYMAGEVARPGVYSLTGRKITLLQAVAASGGLTAVAVPWRTEVVRRISETEEEIIYVDISQIARGEVPDFYVQPEDLIRVGTDQGAIYNAVHRNAYRATYGVGAVYDTNFAEFYPWSLARKAIVGGT
jgi:protein involved in polysaccharide export with SLBB domain